MLPIWRKKPPNEVARSGGADTGFVHPSGRQAISTALRAFNLNRWDRVAIPEWSSACLIHAVGKIAMPVPIGDVLEYGIPVQAMVIYEQWGWPFQEATLNALLNHFDKIPVIFDRVDSPWEFDIAGLELENRPYADVRSMSKILGLPGGGILELNSERVPFEDLPEDAARWHVLKELDDVDRLNDIAKSELAYLPDAVKNYVSDHDLQSALNLELADRRRNLKAVDQTLAAEGWELWMRQVLEGIGGPGIAPLFRGEAEEVLNAKSSVLAEKFNIESSVYHFNFSADILEPVYDKCLAVPIHGTMTPGRISEFIGHWN